MTWTWEEPQRHSDFIGLGQGLHVGILKTLPDFTGKVERGYSGSRMDGFCGQLVPASLGDIKASCCPEPWLP